MIVRDAAFPPSSVTQGTQVGSLCPSVKTSSFVSVVIACLELSLLNTSAAEDCCPAVSHKTIAFQGGRKNVTIDRRTYLSP